MALGQGLSNWLRYVDIAQAGQPQSLASDALVELGALFTQMDFDLGKEKDEDKPRFTEEFLDKKFKITDEARDKLKVKLGERRMHKFGKLNERPDPVTPINPIKPIKEKQKEIISVTQTQTTGGAAGLSTFAFDVSGKDGYVVDLNAGSQYAAPTSAGYMGPQEIDLSGEEGYDDEGNLLVAELAKLPSSINRLNDKTLAALKGLRYSRKGEDDSPLFRVAHIASSPFVKTDNLDYRQMRRAVIPEYAKRLGGAAAAGYNLVIDKYNYDQKVKADYEEELEDQMGSLNVEADFVGAESRAKYIGVATQKKKQLGQAFNDYANGKISRLDYENVKQQLFADVNNIAQATTNLQKLRQDYLDRKGTFDIDASDSEMVDFYNTIEKDPDNLSIATFDGIDYVVGKTRGGEDIKVAASKIANGTAGFKLVEKANLAPIISGAVKNINTFGERDVKTEFGFGRASATPEKAKEIGINSLKAALATNENDLRSLMGQIYGVDHNLYQLFIGNDPKANRAQMLQDAAEHLYNTQVKPLVFEQEKTTRIDPSKVAFGGKTQRGSVAERNRAANIARLQKIGNITPNNFNNIESEIDLTKYSLVEEEGAYYVTDKKGNVLTTLDLSNQQGTKSKLLSFMKGGGGIGEISSQSDLSQYNFDIK